MLRNGDRFCEWARDLGVRDWREGRRMDDGSNKKKRRMAQDRIG